MSFVTYHFVSSLRRGLTAALDAPASGARATFQMRLTLAARKAGTSTTISEHVDQTVQLLGPGDVLGFHDEVVVRTDPKPGVGDFEDNYFPAIEFAEPDFLWRFTADAADADGRLVPWITLIVLKSGGEDAELEPGVQAPGLPPSIRVLDPAALPDLDHAARWAHVQVVGPALDGDAEARKERLAAMVIESPQLASCRLVAPRRLRPRTAYAALVVPTFELGRCAGLGLEPADGTTAATLAWNREEIGPGYALPVYHRWDFRTGVRGDFEYLVRLLRARPGIDGLGQRSMDCAAPGFGVPGVTVDGAPAGEEHILGLEGALQRSTEPTEPPPYTHWGADSSAPAHPFRTSLAADVLNRPQSDVRLGSLLTGAPDAPPAITGVAVQYMSPTSVTVRWTTAEERTSVVDYGPPGEEAEVVASPELVQDHSVLLSGLAPGVAYRFKVGGVGVASPPGSPPLTTPDGTFTLPALPTVTPPIYGRWHAAAQEVTPTGAGWLDVLNLDPRHRAAAGFGAEVVRRQQEPLMASAWDQLGPIERANDLLRRGQLGRDASDILWRRLSAVSADSLLAITAAVHQRTKPIAAGGGTPDSVHVILARETNLPRGALFASFRRIARPRGPIRKRQRPWTRNVVSELIGGTLAVAGAAPKPAGMADICAITDHVKSVAEQAPVLEPDDVTLPVGSLEGGSGLGGGSGTGGGLGTGGGSGTGGSGTPSEPSGPPIVFCDSHLTCADLHAEIPDGDPQEAIRVAACAALDHWLQQEADAPAPIQVAPGFVAALRTKVLAAIHPKQTITRRVRARLRLDGDVPPQADPLDPIMWAPDFPQPMYEPLREISQDLILPGVKHVPQNTILLLQANRRFLESYMVGLNHEMAAELLWSGYPTDQRGSYFRQFWDVRDRVPTAAERALDEKIRKERWRDVKPLHLWEKQQSLGANRPQGASAESMVLVVRGDLLRRYPNTVIYTVPAGGGANPAEGSPRTYPTFKGDLPPDLTFLGFPFGRAAAEGYYFVIEEQVGEPRFGLDLPGGDGPVPLTDWQDLAWDHFTADEETDGWHLDGRVPGAPPGSTLNLDGWNAGQTPTAARIARVTMQSPFRVAIKGSTLLES